MPNRRSAQSARSDKSDVDTDGTESELAKLERQFRIIARDLQAYNLQAREQIHKQQQEIEKLLKEQEELHQKLGSCKSFSRPHQDDEAAESLHALLEQGDLLNEALRKEKCRQAELEKEITNMQLKIAELRKEFNNSETQRLEERRTQKAIRTLEYKLDRALTHFNEQMTKNSQLRKEVQTLHMEHLRFQQLRNRLQKELYEVHKKIEGVVNLSIAAYDARVDAQAKIIMMKEKAVKDLAHYNSELKELERHVAHECHLKEFMTTKCNERSAQDKVFEMKEQRRMDSGGESPDALEEVFKKIQTMTGEDNLDMVVTRFIQAEDQKFALFNFVNEQNNEADALRDRIGQMQAEIEQFQVEGLQREKDHCSLMSDIDKQQRKIKSQAENYENQASTISKLLENVKKGMNSIFSKMEWDCSKIGDTLGRSTRITENNIMPYLGLVEDKTNELLTIQAYLNYKDLEKNNPRYLAKFLLGQNSELLQHNTSIQPAVNNVDDEAEESPLTDEEERPLSQDELRKRISKRVLQ